MGGGSEKSRYVLIVENLSSYSRSKDIRREMENKCGTVLNVERNIRDRSALVEFKRSSDAAYAYDKMDGYLFDGREWRVDYATRKDFEFYEWKWFEKKSRGRSKSRSRSADSTNTDKGLSRSPSRSSSESR